jgi:exodeoxyribonuclease V alpha subunit
MARPVGTLHAFVSSTSGVPTPVGWKPPAPLRRKRTPYPSHELDALVESYSGSKESPVPGLGLVSLRTLVEELLSIRGITLRRLWSLVVAHRTTKNPALDLYKLAENPYLAARESPPAIPFDVCRALEKRFKFRVKPRDVAAAMVVDRVHDLAGGGTDPYVPVGALDGELAQAAREYGKAMEEALQQEIVAKKLDGRVMCTTRALYLAMRNIEATVRAMCDEGTADVESDAPWGPTFDAACGERVFTETQRKALLEAYNRPLAVITGGPGTGKTTVVAAINAIFHAQGTVVINLAFCGKAVKELRRRLLPDETLASRCFTLHRFLKSVAHEDDDLDIESSVIVCDEASMVDVILFAELLEHVEKTQSRLILVGDPNQLAPVGLGTPFNDMVEAREGLNLPNVRLTETNRYASEMAAFVAGICEGRWEPPESVTFMELPTISSDRMPDEDEVRERVTGPLSAYIVDNGLESSLDDTLYLTPQREYAYGTRVVGEALQAIYNPDGAHYPIDTGPYGDRFQDGDVVVRTANTYSQSASKRDRYNGDTAVVRHAGANKVTVTYDDDDGIETLSTRRFREEFSLGYIRTIHKSQGGEAKNVVLVGPASCHSMWTREGARRLLLVAVSRAKERVHVLGHKRALERCLRTRAPARVGRLFGVV